MPFFRWMFEECWTTWWLLDSVEGVRGEEDCENLFGRRDVPEEEGREEGPVA